jgi:hypothetical protein
MGSDDNLSVIVLHFGLLFHCIMYVEKVERSFYKTSIFINVLLSIALLGSTTAFGVCRSYHSEFYGVRKLKELINVLYLLSKMAV